MGDASSGVIYPRYCFHLSPTANTWCFFRSCELHALDQYPGFDGEGFFFHRNLPIKWVRIVGVVVAIDEFAGRRCYTLDDSSGACIEALVLLPTVTNPPATETETSIKQAYPTNLTPSVCIDEIDVGAIVDVKGALSSFRNERQIKIEKVVVLRSTVQEVALWEKRATFRLQVLDQPWVLRDKQVRRCRKEAERSDVNADGVKQRSKALSRSRSRRANEVQPKAAEPEPDEGGNKRRKPTKEDLKEALRIAALGETNYSALGL